MFKKRNRTSKKRDAGFTLPEVLVAMVVSGMLISALAGAFAVIARSQGPAQQRIAASKDVSFVQTWLPIDLSSAKELNKEPDHQPAVTETLPGTNVVTIRRVDLTSPTAPDILIAYRYVEDTELDEWQLVRYEIRNPGQVPGETVARVGVAHALPAPPDGWDPLTDAPTHAVDLTTRNPTVLREAGENITVYFDGGDSFITGGAGLGPGSILPSADNPEFADPPSPPSRCGGDVSIIIDSSGSVDNGSTGGVNNGIVVKNEVKGIIDNFVGTPSNVKIYDFNYDGNARWPTDRNAPFISLLNDGPGVDDIRNAVDGINYDGTTNWEDGLRIALNDGSDYRDAPQYILGSLATYQPDLVIFVTDGKPNKVMDDKVPYDVDDQDDYNLAAEAARDVSDVLKSEGVTFKGIFIGDSASTYLPNLKTAIGPIEWEVTPETAPVGNALTADVFEGGFGDLGEIFRQIFVAECGGTMTVQKRVDGSQPTSGVWTYTTSNGVKDLDVEQAPSITLAYNLGQNAEEWVPLIETPVAGYQFTDITCTSGVDPIDPSRIRDLTPADTGKEILVKANEAISCLVHSTELP